MSSHAGVRVSAAPEEPRLHDFRGALDARPTSGQVLARVRPRRASLDSRAGTALALALVWHLCSALSTQASAPASGCSPWRLLKTLSLPAALMAALPGPRALVPGPGPSRPAAGGQPMPRDGDPGGPTRAVGADDGENLVLRPSKLSIRTLFSDRRRLLKTEPSKIPPSEKI